MDAMAQEKRAIKELIKISTGRSHIQQNIRLPLTHPENITLSPTTAAAGGKSGSTEV